MPRESHLSTGRSAGGVGILYREKRGLFPQVVGVAVAGCGSAAYDSARRRSDRCRRWRFKKEEKVMMKSTLFAVLFAMFLGAAVTIAADKPAGDKPATKPASTQPSINKFCAVEGGDHAVDKDVFVMYKGQKIG